MAKRAGSYPLQAVVDGHHARRESEQQALAQALHDLNRAAADVDVALNHHVVCEANVHQAMTRLTDAVQRGVRAARLLRIETFLTARRAESTDAESDLASKRAAWREAQLRVHALQSAVVDADRNVKLQETHRAKWTQRQAAQQRRRRQSQDDEVGRMLHERQRRKD